LSIRLKGLLRNYKMIIHIHDFDLDPPVVQ
jgi:hypothetical protein